MKIIETDLPGCRIIEPRVFGDSRGEFFESWNKPRWAEAGLDFDVVQSNVSISSRGVEPRVRNRWQHTRGILISLLRSRVWHQELTQHRR